VLSTFPFKYLDTLAVPRSQAVLAFQGVLLALELQAILALQGLQSALMKEGPKSEFFELVNLSISQLQLLLFFSIFTLVLNFFPL
jgi:hypothetical protein